MTVEQSAAAFLVVSCLSLLVQAWGLHRLAARAQSPAARGLTRTSVCRVAVSCLYVYVGTNALALHHAVLVTTLLAFAATQATWQANTVADVRLKRSLD
ncbi:MAG TPA: hypothetical protein VFW64_12170 [Pseudonocardiaceae bacterium]|nr:hypothetical protein [Pseudonocardiaceae bacterium]